MTITKAFTEGVGLSDITERCRLTIRLIKVRGLIFSVIHYCKEDDLISTRS